MSHLIGGITIDDTRRERMFHEESMKYLREKIGEYAINLKLNECLHNENIHPTQCIKCCKTCKNKCIVGLYGHLTKFNGKKEICSKKCIPVNDMWYCGLWECLDSYKPDNINHDQKIDDIVELLSQERMLN